MSYEEYIDKYGYPEDSIVLETYEIESEDDYDFEDIDCEDCGLKFFVRPSLYKNTGKEWPRKCERCKKGLPPLYEY